MQAISGETMKKSTQDLLKWVQGPETTTAAEVRELNDSREGSLVFWSTFKESSPEQLKASIYVIEEKILNSVRPLLSSKQTLYTCSSIRDAMAALLPLFDRAGRRPNPGISPAASVSPSARLGKDVCIAAGAVVEEAAVIGDGAWIQAGAVIEAHAHVGPHTRVQSRAVIGSHCIVGAHCQIGSGTVIGSDGFGFTSPKQTAPKKIAQIGIVQIGDYVEFGANCAIDRGTISATVIGDGNKFDNFCHVAHNCKIGKNGLFAGGFFVAGSSEIGDHFMCGGNVVVADHVKIGSGVVLGGRATVTKDIETPGAYTGYPLQPLKDGLRTLANLAHLTEMRERIKHLEDQVEKLLVNRS